MHAQCVKDGKETIQSLHAAQDSEENETWIKNQALYLVLVAARKMYSVHKCVVISVCLCHNL